MDREFKYMGGDDKYFNTPYSRINVCNMVISLIDEQPEPDATDKVEKSRVKGEAYFLRAIYYFMLANLYCEPYDPATASSKMGMPLKFSEVIEDVEFDRSSLESTYRAILSDLENAEKCLEGRPANLSTERMFTQYTFSRAGSISICRTGRMQ